MWPRRLNRRSARQFVAANWRERILIALAFEITGICLIAPVYQSATGSTPGDSYGLILAVSSVAALWCGIFNALFDRLAQCFRRRVRGRSPHAVRMLQSALRELTEIPVTLPVIHALTGADLGNALCADIALALLYIVYGYLFQLLVDWLSVHSARRRLQVVRTDTSAMEATISFRSARAEGTSAAQ